MDACTAPSGCGAHPSSLVIAPDSDDDLRHETQPKPPPHAEQNVWRGRQRWQQITRTLPKWSAAQGSSGASPRGSGKAGDGDSSAADHRLEERGVGQRQRIRGGGACVYERKRMRECVCVLRWLGVAKRLG